MRVDSDVMYFLRKEFEPLQEVLEDRDIGKLKDYRRNSLTYLKKNELLVSGASYVGDL